jgi:hypothetical protein
MNLLWADRHRKAKDEIRMGWEYERVKEFEQACKCYEEA